MIPYRHNDFIQATRPIKIVESIMAGVPVVTVPVNGYEKCSFIRFADTIDDFSEEIDYLLEHPINKDSIEYKNFVASNTWESIARRIDYEMSK